MFSSIWNDIKQQFNYGNTLTRIILINIGVFVIVSLIVAFSFDESFRAFFPRYLSLNQSLYFDATHPWVIVTHMFTHFGFMHILWNMLLLYWMGRVVGDLIGDHRILPLYLLGGLMGGLAYLVFAQYFHIGGYAYGASAAVMAVIVASGFLAPDYLFNLILIGIIR